MPGRAAGVVKVMVVATSTCRMEMSHRYPAYRSARANGSGNRAHHRSANTRIWPGAEPVADLLQGDWVIAGGDLVGERSYYGV
jgi:hypothetical protein